MSLDEIKPDNYGGIVINDSSVLPETELEFESQLSAKINQWKKEGVRSIQIKFRPPKCHLMNPASKMGFFFHHSQNKENYVLMILWLDEKTPCRIPAFAHHYVGVGGLVLRQN